MKKKILKIAATLIACATIIAFCTAAAGTSTTSEAYIPFETTLASIEDNNLPECTSAPEEEVIVLEPSYSEKVETRNRQELEMLLETSQEKLDASEAMLEACQILGYDEINPVVVLANEEVANAQSNVDYYQTILDEVIAEERAAQRAAEYPTATTIWIYLTEELGYNKYVASGIMGNLMAEVGGQTLNIQPQLTNGTYYGMCQWKLCYYPQVKGMGVEAQLDLLADTIEAEWKTFGNLSGYTYEEFLALEDEQAAALAFAKTYERCGSGSYSKRQSNATKALEYYTN